MLWRSSLAMFVFLCVAPAWAQQDQIAQKIADLPWQSAPAVVPIGKVAQFSLSGDLRYLDPTSTSRFLELNGNPPRDDEYTLAPRSFDWFAIMVSDDTGHVQDDEQLNPDELLKTLRQQNEESFEERRRLHLPLLRLEGWCVVPHYDAQTKRLEWGTRFVNEEDKSIVNNYTIRILGRSGIINAVLVSDSDELMANVQKFHAALRGFNFDRGEGYADFRQGDRIAEYGLAALIVGGASAAAVSSGALKGLGKVIGLGAFAIIAAVGGLIRRIFRRRA